MACRFVGVCEQHRQDEICRQRRVPGGKALRVPPIGHRPVVRRPAAGELARDLLQRARAPAAEVAVGHIGVGHVRGDEDAAAVGDDTRRDGGVDVLRGSGRPVRARRKISTAVELDDRHDRGANREPARDDPDAGGPGRKGRRAGRERGQRDRDWIRQKEGTAAHDLTVIPSPPDHEPGSAFRRPAPEPIGKSISERARKRAVVDHPRGFRFAERTRHRPAPSRIVCSSHRRNGREQRAAGWPT